MSTWLQEEPKIKPPLAPEFRPMGLGWRKFLCEAENAGGPKLVLALERNDAVSWVKVPLLPADHAQSKSDLRFADRLLKYLLWQRGAGRVYAAGPKEVTAFLQQAYRKGGERSFDAEFMANVYETGAFEVIPVESEKDLPPQKESVKAVGGHWDGCRIGFDAGGSDRKVSAVIDGKPVFTTETVWEPKIQSDPLYHVNGVIDSIEQALKHLPKLDAIGVSSAGIYVANKTRVASLFRKVPPDLFEKHIKNLYPDVAKRFGDVPLEVANDGDVTALAGSMNLEDAPVLGIAMGTSLAAGYVNRDRRLLGWLNELAFAPVDESPEAPVDEEWSGDKGTGVLHFSQDAAIRLAPRAGITLDATLSPGAKLKEIQKYLKEGHEGARKIFESIGVFLGYVLLQHALFYDLKHVLTLGRVTSGEGGEIIQKKAREVLEAEDSALSSRVHLHLPGEAERRVGQAVAAASLPEIPKKG